MKKDFVSIPYDEEKYSTLKMYLERNGMHFEEELIKLLDTLYVKNVPTAVREYLSFRSGNEEIVPNKRRRKKTESVHDPEETEHE